MNPVPGLVGSRYVGPNVKNHIKIGGKKKTVSNNMFMMYFLLGCEILLSYLWGLFHKAIF